MTAHRIETYKDAAGEWRWRRVAANGETAADSGEGYVNKADMLAQVAEQFPGDEVRELGSEESA